MNNTYVVADIEYFLIFINFRSLLGLFFVNYNVAATWLQVLRYNFASVWL